MLSISEIPEKSHEKDYYVNMGKTQGVHEGSILEVTRKVATYDLLSERLYKEVTFPIAKLRVIHTEGKRSDCSTWISFFRRRKHR